MLKIQWQTRSGFFIDNFKHIARFFPVITLLTLNE